MAKKAVLRIFLLKRATLCRENTAQLSRISDNPEPASSRAQVRAAAAVAIGALLEAAASRAYLGIAEVRPAARQPARWAAWTVSDESCRIDAVPPMQPIFRSETLMNRGVADASALAAAMAGASRRSQNCWASWRWRPTTPCCEPPPRRMLQLHSRLPAPAVRMADAAATTAGSPGRRRGRGPQVLRAALVAHRTTSRCRHTAQRCRRQRCGRWRRSSLRPPCSGCRRSCCHAASRCALKILVQAVHTTSTAHSTDHIQNRPHPEGVGCLWKLVTAVGCSGHHHTSVGA